MPPDDNPFSPDVTAKVVEPKAEMPDSMHPEPPVEPRPEPEPQLGIPANQLSEIVGPLKQALEESRQANEILRRQLADMNQPAPVPDPSREEFGEAFYAEPKETIRKVFEEASAPIVRMQAEQSLKTNMHLERQRVEAEFGPSAWTNVIKPALDKALGDSMHKNPELFLNPTAMENAVNTLVGRHIKELMKLQNSYQEVAEKEKLEALAKIRNELMKDLEPNLSGGIRRPSPGGATLSDEHVGYLEKMFEATGVRRDPEVLAAMMNSGSTLEDYRAAKERLKQDS